MDTYSTLKQMVEHSCNIQMQVDRDGVIPAQYYRSFCTINFSVGRRSGHTTAIAKLCLEFFRKALIIHMNFDHVRIFSRIFREECGISEIKNLKTKEIEMQDGSIYCGAVKPSYL